jgi:hypothetical protein
MAAPKPALRYVLLPELKEINPGNPIQNYMKCFMEQHKFFFDKDAFERREKLLAMPLKELPARELKEYGGYALRQADWAARLDNPDWEFILTLKAQGIYALLPDVQQMRGLARAIQVRFRAEVALGRFDDGVRTAQTMFAMSRHLGEHPTIIANLIGIAIANIAIGPLEEMLEQPGCPNLYWALTNLPDPLVPLNKGIDGDRMTTRMEFRDLDDRAPMSAERLKKFIAEKEQLLQVGDPKPGTPTVRAWMDERTKDPATVSAARRRLVEYGIPEERLARFPAEQVILLDERRETEVRLDEGTKTFSIPPWQAEALDVHGTVLKPPALFADVLMPAFDKANRLRWRLYQRIALVRHVEALRLHAAEHGGALPARLSDLTVPLPEDPFTGKPFRYDVSGNTAHLRGTPPPAEEKNPSFNLHYEVTLQK